MNYRSILLTVFIVFGTHAAYALSQKDLADTVEDSIYEFFNSSGRRVENVNIESFSHLNSGELDYLVEAEVKAESPVKPSIIPYHCGVFIKKYRNKWESQQTICEALPETSF